MIHKKSRIIATFFLAIMVAQLLLPTTSWALTSGPTQPEVQSFQPAGTTEMVDLFSGDFSYNIPLFELPGPSGGYPFNLSYQAGITMDQEASWVGLGWSMQPGAITRQMRGLPDEFRGDQVKTKMTVKPSVTVGLGAGAGIEVFGADPKVSLSAGFSVYNNNYKGFGYNIDANIGFSKANEQGITGGLGLGLSLDSQEGLGVAPSLSLGGKIGQFGLSAPYNSRTGLSGVSLGHSVAIDGRTIKKGAKEREKSDSFGGSSATLSLSNPGYTPQITMPMNGINLSATLKAGGAWWGIFGAPYLSGFYNEQTLENDGKEVITPSYGYLNYQHMQSEKDLLDFNREKDGMVNKESPNLAVPSMTYDIYSVTGQGIGMMYRPFRNDYGLIHDQETTSQSTSVGLGLDFGPAASHVGVNLSVNHAQSTSGKWSEKNNMAAKARFQKKSLNSTYEPAYFKVHGETTSEGIAKLTGIGGENPVRVALSGDRDNAAASNRLEYRVRTKYESIEAPEIVPAAQSRVSRNQVVQPITNGELMSASNVEALPEFKVQFFEGSSEPKRFMRSTLSSEKHHIAGYTALTSDGLRYIYGIPAYNLAQEEVTFSASNQSGTENLADVNASSGDPSYKHPGSDNFLKRTALPKYAHSHLLTSILGPDYVDLTNDGVSYDDLGYWVKFTYRRTTAHFKWRDPYTKAHRQEGWLTDDRDDKGSLTYGEKELWYLEQAETKSHIAMFIVAPRHDGKGVNDILQDNANVKGGDVYSLKQIKLYTRLGWPSSPLKVTNFAYDYSLCPNTPNNDGILDNDGSIPDRNANYGKLTLKKVWFEYGATSTRGRLNPYEFTYNNSDNSNNYPYDVLAYDRWGTYKPYPGIDKFYNNYFPYAEQDPSKKGEIDKNAGAWSLTKIRLPSGGEIMVDYESDDYGYVQHKTAMQMTQLLDPYSISDNGLNSKFNLNATTKVRFRLEQPISANTTLSHPEVVKRYIDTKTWQLYFKMLVNLREPVVESSEGYFEYITGYADINPSTALMGLEKASTETNADYVYGYFHLKQERHKQAYFHPMSMRAWQHLRTNQPELANPEIKQGLEKTSNNNKRIELIKSLGPVGIALRKIFQETNFYGYCNGKDWGKQVDATKSWIRLNSVDKIKYGGGLRVKQITLKDNWSQDMEGVYGQTYDYTMKEGDQTISSGVAAYEPLVGGDENALRVAKKYTQSIPLHSDNNLFFEYPVNESNYPGPQVGYRKVSVMSLASAAREGSKPLMQVTGVFPAGLAYGTTGMTVHEFYTAKDFPVIVDETEKANKQHRLSFPIPFMGNVAVINLTSSQGYSIVTNDMHGKQKVVSNFRQDKNGKLERDPISWVKYHYRSEPKVMDGERVSALANLLIQDDNGETLSDPNKNLNANSNGNPKYYLAQESEFFYDMRQYEDKTWGGGVRNNLDLSIFFIATIPSYVPWLNLGYTTNVLRTSSTNKIIFKAGILESVEAFDGGSTVKTENLKWDKQTGQVVLTRVNNNFDDPVFSYARPAFREYQGMGAAYKNTGLTFNLNSVQRKDPNKNDLYIFQHALPEGTLVQGDEILLYGATGPLENPVKRVVYTGDVEGDHIFYTELEPALDPSVTNYQGMIVRSGYRNQLGVSAATITALEDPSFVKGTLVYFPKTISVPKP
jgi:hypothetical protein